MPRAIEQSLEISQLAGHLPPNGMLVDVARLEREHYSRRPDLDDHNQLVGNLTKISNRSGSVQLPVMEATS